MFTLNVPATFTLRIPYILPYFTILIHYVLSRLINVYSSDYVQTARALHYLDENR